MNSILNQIIEAKKEEIKKLRMNFTLSRFKDSQFFNTKCLNVFESFKKFNGIGIISEIKNASPSKGIIRQNFNHIEIAEIYFKKNVQAVSILTDKYFFKGDINYLFDIAKFKEAPLLRKDFILDELQIYEAKSNGADIILLISEILSKNQISELTAAAKEIGLFVLLELHSKEEVEKINFRENNLIGINNRNLLDFSVSFEATKTISEVLPENILLISESGISCKDDIQFLKDTRTNGILIGEHLMCSDNIESDLSRLQEWCSFES